MTYDQRDTELLLLSILRCYDLKTRELLGPEPLNFVATVNLLNYGVDGLGPNSIAHLLLSTPTPAPKRGINRLKVIAPEDCKEFLNDSASLATHIKKTYPAAYDVFKDWQQAAPGSYFRNELTEENLAHLKNDGSSFCFDMHNIISAGMAGGIILPPENGSPLLPIQSNARETAAKIGWERFRVKKNAKRPDSQPLER